MKVWLFVFWIYFPSHIILDVFYPCLLDASSVEFWFHFQDFLFCVCSSLERSLLDLFRDFVGVWLAPAHSFLSISGPLHTFNNQEGKTLQVSAGILKLAFCAFPWIAVGYFGVLLSPGSSDSTPLLYSSPSCPESALGVLWHVV